MQNLTETLVKLDFTAPDEIDSSHLTLANGNRLSVLKVNGYEKAVRLADRYGVRIWYVATHQLPDSIIAAIIGQAIADNAK